MARLAGVERFGYHIESPEIEHFRPKRFVRQFRGHDQERCFDAAQVVQDIPPRAIGQTALADNYGYAAVAQAPEGGAACSRSSNPAAEASE